MEPRVLICAQNLGARLHATSTRRRSSATVRNQLAAVYEKLGVHTKLELARRLASTPPA